MLSSFELFGDFELFWVILSYFESPMGPLGPLVPHLAPFSHNCSFVKQKGNFPENELAVVPTNFQKKMHFLPEN